MLSSFREWNASDRSEVPWTNLKSSSFRFTLLTAALGPAILEMCRFISPQPLTSLVRYSDSMGVIDLESITWSQNVGPEVVGNLVTGGGDRLREKADVT